MPVQVIRNDITKVKADAIVNTANPYPQIGGGTDSAIYRAAGREKLLAEREKIGEIARGEAAVTPAFALKARYIIHTVGPVWNGGNSGEEDTLRRCYRNSLCLAKKLGCRSIAFPLISSGTYGFPRGKSLAAALSEFHSFIMEEEEEMDILLVVFDPESSRLSAKLFPDMEAYIDDHYAGEKSLEERREDYRGRLRWDERREDYRGGQIREERREDYRGWLSREELQRRAFMENLRIGKADRRGEAELPGEPNRTDEVGFRGVSAYPETADLFGELNCPEIAENSAEEDLEDVEEESSCLWEAESEEDESWHEAESVSYQAKKDTGREKNRAPEYSRAVCSRAERSIVRQSAKKSAALRSLDSLMGMMEDTFQERLFRLIDEREMTNPEVYKKANLTKKLFSKINSNSKYQPTKATALSLCIALELNLDETIDLLARAGLALSPCSKTDTIVRYFIETGKYDILAVDYALTDHGEKPLGNYN